MAGGNYYDADGNIIGGWYIDDERLPWVECRKRMFDAAPRIASYVDVRNADGSTENFIEHMGHRKKMPTWEEWQKDPTCPATE